MSINTAENTHTTRLIQRLVRLDYKICSLANSGGGFFIHMPLGFSKKGGHSFLGMLKSFKEKRVFCLSN